VGLRYNVAFSCNYKSGNSGRGSSKSALAICRFAISSPLRDQTLAIRLPSRGVVMPAEQTTDCRSQSGRAPLWAPSGYQKSGSRVSRWRALGDGRRGERANGPSMRRGHAGTSHRLGDSGSWIVEPSCAKGIKPKIAGSRHSLSFVKSTAFAPSWTPLRVSPPHLIS
jgi:hypothetical protein